MKKTTKTVTAKGVQATLTINDLPKMSLEKKTFLVKWLRTLATNINTEKDMKVFAPVFRARLYK